MLSRPIPVYPIFLKYLVPVHWGKRKKKFLKPLDFSCNVNYNFRVTESEVIV